jgi:predicted molibdopterin-dependent oxidoreductase YjgC
MVRKAIEPRGSSRPDWEIIADLAQRIISSESRKGGRVKRRTPDGTTHSTEDIMREIAALTPSYAGVSHARLERGERCSGRSRDENHPGTPILHIGKFTRGRGKFTPDRAHTPRRKTR